MIIFCNTFLPNDRIHTNSAVIGKIFKPIPVVERVAEVDVTPKMTFLFTDSNMSLETFNFYISFLNYGFYL